MSSKESENNAALRVLNLRKPTKPPRHRRLMA